MKAFTMKVALFLFAVLASVTAIACLNEKHVTKSGKTVLDNAGLLNMRFHRTHDVNEINKRIADIEKALSTTSDNQLGWKNDLAVNYIKLGRIEEAQKILEDLFKNYRDDYHVVVNLGTLYELKGENEKALQFITKAIQLNPDSHQESEWFHVRVLETKLKNLSNEAVVEEDILRLKNRRQYPKNTAQQVHHQLFERIPFTPAPNAMMAKILTEYGAFLADYVSIKLAYVIYSAAIDYDPGNRLRTVEKRDSLLPFFRKYKEVVPVTGSYADRVIDAATQNVERVAVSVLDKGLNYLKEKQEAEEKKRRRKQYLVYGGIGAAVLMALLVYLLKRRRSTTTV